MLIPPYTSHIFHIQLACIYSLRTHTLDHINHIYNFDLHIHIAYIHILFLKYIHTCIIKIKKIIFKLFQLGVDINRAQIQCICYILKNKIKSHYILQNLVLNSATYKNGIIMEYSRSSIIFTKKLAHLIKITRNGHLALLLLLLLPSTSVVNGFLFLFLSSSSYYFFLWYFQSSFFFHDQSVIKILKLDLKI